MLGFVCMWLMFLLWSRFVVLQRTFQTPLPWFRRMEPWRFWFSGWFLLHVFFLLLWPGGSLRQGICFGIDAVFLLWYYVIVVWDRVRLEQMVRQRSFAEEGTGLTRLREMINIQTGTQLIFLFWFYPLFLWIGLGVYVDPRFYPNRLSILVVTLLACLLFFLTGLWLKWKYQQLLPTSRNEGAESESGSPGARGV